MQISWREEQNFFWKMRGGLNFYETSNAIMMEMPIFREDINDNDNGRSMTRGWFRSLEEKQLKQKQQELAEQQQKVFIFLSFFLVF